MADFKSAIYGWSIVYKTSDDPMWRVDDNDQSNGLPAIFEDWQMTVDRVRYLESKQIPVRVVAVLVQPSDFRLDGTNKYDEGLATPVDGWWPKVRRKKGGKGGKENDSTG
jgi:hypothetical protein